MGKVVWLGVVEDSSKNLRSKSVKSFELTYAGQAEECHAGMTRPSCSRVLDLYPRGTDIRNVRQLSVVSEEELNLIATKLGVDSIDPSSIGASMVVSGIPDFTHIPPASRLQVVGSGTTVCVDMENRPCIFSARVVAEDRPLSPADNIAKRFKEYSWGMRGVTAWVEREGGISIGDEIKLYIPDQVAWKHLGEHLSESAKEGKSEGDISSTAVASQCMSCIMDPLLLFGSVLIVALLCFHNIYLRDVK